MKKTFRKKNSKIRWKERVGIILFLIINVLFLIEGIQSCGAIHDFHSEDVKEYEGQYEFSKKRIYRNTCYYLTLDNGDFLTILIPNEYFQGETPVIEEFSELNISYSKQKFIFGQGGRACFSIHSSDGSVTLLNESIVLQDLKGRAIVCFVIFFIGCFLGILIFLPIDVLLSMFIKSKKVKRNRRKGNTDNASPCPPENSDKDEPT